MKRKKTIFDRIKDDNERLPFVNDGVGRTDGDREISVSMPSDRFSESMGLCDAKNTRWLDVGFIVFPQQRRRHDK